MPVTFYTSDNGLPYDQAIDNTGGSGNQQLYIGLAEPGTPTSSAFWQIKKLRYDASGQVDLIRFANGDKSFKFVWDSRSTYSYLGI